MNDPTDSGLGAAAAASDEAAQTPWPALIRRIQANDAEAMEELYQVFSRGIRFFLQRQLGTQDVDDAVHDTFLTVTQAIRRGEVRDPERLMGFVWAVVRRQLAAQIERAVTMRHQCDDLERVPVPDGRLNPERNAILRQNQSLAYRVLNEVSGRDREILVRFYLKEQSQQEICQAMDLTDTQFRLLKSRAKARFGALGRRKLARHRICW